MTVKQCAFPDPEWVTAETEKLIEQWGKDKKGLGIIEYLDKYSSNRYKKYLRKYISVPSATHDHD